MLRKKSDNRIKVLQAVVSAEGAERRGPDKKQVPVESTNDHILDIIGTGDAFSRIPCTSEHGSRVASLGADGKCKDSSMRRHSYAVMKRGRRMDSVRCNRLLALNLLPLNQLLIPPTGSAIRPSKLSIKL